VTPPKTGIQTMHGRKVEVRPLPGIQTMHGRKVEVRPLQDQTYKCADCPEPAQFAVLEKESQKNQSWMPTVWYWCGKCDLGG
jgi:hypothetical protein